GLVLLIGGTTMSALLAAAEDGASPPLDKRLLKDLDDDLLQGLPAAAPGKAAKNDLDAKLKEDLEGSDIGAAPVEDPLQQISQRMRAAQQRIGQQDLSLETRE